MELDAKKIADDTRQRFKNAPGNEYLDDHWKWSEAKVIKGKDGKLDTVLVPAKYPSVTPDMILVDSKQVRTLIENGANAANSKGIQAFMDRKTWQLTLPTFDSWKAEIDKDSKTNFAADPFRKASRESVHTSKYLDDRSTKAREIEYEAILLHELEHKSGASEHGAFTRQRHYERSQGKLISKNLGPEILSGIAIGYQPYELGRSVAEVANFNSKDPIVAKWSPGGEAVAKVADDMFERIRRMLEKPGLSEEIKKNLEENLIRMMKLKMGTHDVKLDFITGFAFAVGEKQGRAMATSMGFSEKEINSILIDEVSSFSLTNRAAATMIQTYMKGVRVKVGLSFD